MFQSSQQTTNKLISFLHIFCSFFRSQHHALFRLDLIMAYFNPPPTPLPSFSFFFDTNKITDSFSAVVFVVVDFEILSLFTFVLLVIEFDHLLTTLRIIYKLSLTCVIVTLAPACLDLPLPSAFFLISSFSAFFVQNTSAGQKQQFDDPHRNQTAIMLSSLPLS